MELVTNQVNLFGGMLQIFLPNTEEMQTLADVIAKGKKLRINIVQYRKKRSLTANACMWATLNELAIKLRTTAEELYIEELRKYGVREYLAVIPEAVETLRKTFKIVEVLSKEPITIGKRTDGVTVAVYRGSHTYDTAEFSRLLDGIIQDAQEQGIHTITKEDYDSLIWEDRG